MTGDYCTIGHTPVAKLGCSATLAMRGANEEALLTACILNSIYYGTLMPGLYCRAGAILYRTVPVPYSTVLRIIPCVHETIFLPDEYYTCRVIKSLKSISD